MRFVLVDEIERFDVGRRAEGYKRISREEDYFVDHFPGYPLVPGVLIVESLAQLGGRLVDASVRAASGRRVLPMLARIESAKFFQPVRPGDRLDLEVDLTALGDDIARVAGIARVGGRKVATAHVMYAMLDTANAAAQLTADQAAALESWSERLWSELRPSGNRSTDGGR
jgi:3-hydroxyacyl-[acyl-carrier-protein] dehydratase